MRSVCTSPARNEWSGRCIVWSSEFRNFWISWFGVLVSMACHCPPASTVKVTMATPLPKLCAERSAILSLLTTVSTVFVLAEAEFPDIPFAVVKPNVQRLKSNNVRTVLFFISLFVNMIQRCRADSLYPCKIVWNAVPQDEWQDLQDMFSCLENISASKWYEFQSFII